MLHRPGAATASRPHRYRYGIGFGALVMFALAGCDIKVVPGTVVTLPGGPSTTSSTSTPATSGSSTTSAPPASTTSTTPSTSTSTAPSSTSTSAATTTTSGSGQTTTTKAPATTVLPPATTTTKPPATTTTQAAGTAFLSEAEVASLQLLNAERAKVNLPPLRAVADLSANARKWAEEMRRTGFRHSGDAQMRPFIIAKRSGWGENIAFHSNANMTPAEAATRFNEMWRNSPGHYANMTSRSWTEVGVGLFHDSSGWWAVHQFSNG